MEIIYLVCYIILVLMVFTLLPLGIIFCFNLILESSCPESQIEYNLKTYLSMLFLTLLVVWL